MSGWNTYGMAFGSRVCRYTIGNIRLNIFMYKLDDFICYPCGLNIFEGTNSFAAGENVVVLIGERD